MPAAARLRRHWPSTLPKRALVSRISRFRRNKSRGRPGEETARSEGYVCQFYETDRDRKRSFFPLLNLNLRNRTRLTTPQSVTSFASNWRQHENEINSNDDGAVLCWIGREFRGKSEHGYLEAQRSKVQDPCRDVEEHHGRLLRGLR